MSEKSLELGVARIRARGTTRYRCSKVESFAPYGLLLTDGRRAAHGIPSLDKALTPEEDLETPRVPRRLHPSRRKKTGTRSDFKKFIFLTRFLSTDGAELGEHDSVVIIRERIIVSERAFLGIL